MIGNAKYFVYSYGADSHDIMHYQWIDENGDKQFYVLWKDKELVAEE